MPKYGWMDGWMSDCNFVILLALGQQWRPLRHTQTLLLGPGHTYALMSMSKAEADARSQWELFNSNPGESSSQLVSFG